MLMLDVYEMSLAEEQYLRTHRLQRMRYQSELGPVQIPARSSLHTDKRQRLAAPPAPRRPTLARWIAAAFAAMRHGRGGGSGPRPRALQRVSPPGSDLQVQGSR